MNTRKKPTKKRNTTRGRKAPPASGGKALLKKVPKLQKIKPGRKRGS